MTFCSRLFFLLAVSVSYVKGQHLVGTEPITWENCLTSCTNEGRNVFLPTNDQENDAVWPLIENLSIESRGAGMDSVQKTWLPLQYDYNSQRWEHATEVDCTSASSSCEEYTESEYNNWGSKTETCGGLFSTNTDGRVNQYLFNSIIPYETMMMWINDYTGKFFQAEYYKDSNYYCDDCYMEPISTIPYPGETCGLWNGYVVSDFVSTKNLCVCAPVDQCPDDNSKTEPGQCGCGNAETDTDSDGTPDCIDPDYQFAAGKAEGFAEGVASVFPADTNNDLQLNIVDVVNIIDKIVNSNDGFAALAWP